MGKLIELDEALKIGLQFINQYETFRVAEFTRKINSLPQIDIVGEIEKMIEGITDNLKTGTTSNLEFTDLVAQKYVLERLLQKFKS